MDELEAFLRARPGCSVELSWNEELKAATATIRSQVLKVTVSAGEAEARAYRGMMGASAASLAVHRAVQRWLSESL